MRPDDREILEDVLEAAELWAIGIIDAALGVRSLTDDAQRKKAREDLIDAVEELISHSELRQ